MTTIEAPHRAARGQEEVSMVRWAVVGVPAVVLGVGLAASATVGIVAGFLAVAVILGWSQLAGA